MNQSQGPGGQEADASRDLYHEVNRLALATLEEAAGSESSAELGALLKENEHARQVYANYMVETAALRASIREEPGGGAPEMGVAPKASGRNPLSGHLLTSSFAVLAASLLIAFGSHQLTSNNRSSEAGRPIAVVSADTNESGDTPSEASDGSQNVATLTRLIDAEWKAGPKQARSLSRVARGKRLVLSRGQAEFVFDSGVELLVTGPADFEIVSPMKVIGHLGTYAARVGKSGKGFTIDTPVSSVIDLGTEFGLVIGEFGDTDVAVFKGAVDIDAIASAGSGERSVRKRLKRGEGLRVETTGRLSRIVSIRSNEFPRVGVRPQPIGATDLLIQSVTDNLGELRSKKYYRIVPQGLTEDAQAFVDRGHQWNGLSDQGIPDFLRGADYVMPFNDDKFLDELEITVTTANPCILYVIFDNNMEPPEWLEHQFEDTGADIGLDQARGKLTQAAEIGVGPGVSIDDRFSVWHRTVEVPGEIVLGGVAQPAQKELGWNMFGVAATPLRLRESR